MLEAETFYTAPSRKLYTRFRGITIADFRRLYGTEAQCLDVFIQRRWPVGFHCLQCGNEEMPYQDAGKKALRCKQCRKFVSVKAGTPLENSHLSLQQWPYAYYCWVNWREKPVKTGPEVVRKVNAFLARRLEISPYQAETVRQALQMKKHAKF